MAIPLIFRRSVAALAAIAGLVACYLNYTDSKNTQFAFSALYAFLGVVFVLMAAEERAKSPQSIPIAFPVLSLVNFGLAVWAFKLALLIRS